MSCLTQVGSTVPSAGVDSERLARGEEVQSERSNEVQGKEAGRYLPASFAEEKLRGPNLEAANRDSSGGWAGANQNQLLDRGQNAEPKCR